MKRASLEDRDRIRPELRRKVPALGARHAVVDRDPGHRDGRRRPLGALLLADAHGFPRTSITYSGDRGLAGLAGRGCRSVEGPARPVAEPPGVPAAAGRWARDGSRRRLRGSGLAVFGQTGGMLPG